MSDSRKGDNQYNNMDAFSQTFKGMIFELTYLIVKDDESSIIL
jgi:hypothetical protein